MRAVSGEAQGTRPNPLNRFYRVDDFENGQISGGLRQRHSPTAPALGMNQSGPPQTLEHLGKVGSRDASGLGNLIGRPSRGRRAGQMHDRPQGVLHGL